MSVTDLILRYPRVARQLRNRRTQNEGGSLTREGRAPGASIRDEAQKLVRARFKHIGLRPQGKG